MMRATRRGRLILASTIVGVLAFCAFVQFYGIPLMKQSFISGPTIGTIYTIKALFACLACVGIASGLLVIRHGRKTLQCGEYPPPGTWVWRDTYVRRGNDARRYGWTHLIAGTLACLLSIIMSVYLWQLLDRLAVQYKLH